MHKAELNQSEQKNVQSRFWLSSNQKLARQDSEIVQLKNRKKWTPGLYDLALYNSRYHSDFSNGHTVSLQVSTFLMVILKQIILVARACMTHQAREQ